MTVPAIPNAKKGVTQEDIHSVRHALFWDFLTPGPVINRFETNSCDLPLYPAMTAPQIKTVIDAVLANF